MFKKITTILMVSYAYTLEYRAEIFLWALSGSLPIILLGVWLEASKTGNFSLSSIDFARYFFTIFLVRQFNTIWVIWDFEKELIEGKLSFRLLKPIDPVWRHVSAHIAEKMTRFPLVIFFTILFFTLYPDAFWIPKIERIILFIIAVILSFALRFTIQYTFAMFAFWTERASAIQEFWFLFYLFLSGAIAPLEVFPPQIKQIVELTPFPYMMHFPAVILMGLEVNIGQSFLTIAIWGGLFLIINRWLWRKGLKKYSGMGA